MFKTFKSAQKFIKENEIHMIDLKWGDYVGRWHHVTISAHQFTPQLMRDGVGFDSSAVGFKPVTAGDMALIPDLATGFVDPFFEDTTLSFIPGSTKPIARNNSLQIRARCCARQKSS